MVFTTLIRRSRRKRVGEGKRGGRGIGISIMAKRDVGYRKRRNKSKREGFGGTKVLVKIERTSVRLEDTWEANE